MSQKFGNPGRKPGKPGGQSSGSGDGTPQRPWRDKKPPPPSLRNSDPPQKAPPAIPAARPQQAQPPQQWPGGSLQQAPQQWQGQPPQQQPPPQGQPQQRQGQPPQQWQGQPPQQFQGQAPQQWQGQPPQQWQGQPPQQQGQPPQQWQGQPQQQGQQQWPNQPEDQIPPDPNYYDGSAPNQTSDATALHKIDPGKRLIALMLDWVACYLAAIVVVMIPFVNNFLNLPVVMLVFILIRDFLFGGRGIGKNFMGLRVVDERSMGPPSLVQSILRNIVLLAPFAVLQIVASLLKFIPINSISEVVMQLINILGTVYCAIVLPLESYRAYSRPDSLRKGDEIAGTTIVESAMDFSNPFAR